MKSISIEKSPGMDLPFYIEMATGDAVVIYANNPISTLTVTDWDGNDIDPTITIQNSFSGSLLLLRISGGTKGVVYKIKVKVNFTNPTYKDEVFLSLSVTNPS